MKHGCCLHAVTTHTARAGQGDTQLRGGSAAWGAAAHRCIHVCQPYGLLHRDFPRERRPTRAHHCWCVELACMSGCMPLHELPWELLADTSRRTWPHAFLTAAAGSAFCMGRAPPCAMGMQLTHATHVCVTHMPGHAIWHGCGCSVLSTSRSHQRPRSCCASRHHLQRCRGKAWHLLT